MKKYNVILSCVVILNTLFVVVSCKRSKVPLMTTRRVTYYENESLFVGTIVRLPTGQKRFSQEPPKFAVFWNIKGEKHEVSNPSSSIYATYCAKLNEIIVPGLSGVLMMPIDGRPYRWLLKEDNLLILSLSAESVGAEKMLLLAAGGNSNKMLLIGLDILTEQATKFEISEFPSGMEFVDTDNAVASVGEDLIWVNFSNNGDQTFSVQEKGAQRGSVRGVYNGEIIFYSEDEAEGKKALRFGKTTVWFDQMLWSVVPSKSCLWAITRRPRQQVFRVDTDGSKSQIETMGSRSVIGAGAFSGGLWIATQDGGVMLFGQKREETKITFP